MNIKERITALEIKVNILIKLAVAQTLLLGGKIGYEGLTSFGL